MDCRLDEARAVEGTGLNDSLDNPFAEFELKLPSSLNIVGLQLPTNQSNIECANANSIFMNK